MSADLDALDRGVVEVEQMAAEALSRIAVLEAQVVRLAELDSIMRRADAPAGAVQAAERRVARRHLTPVEGGK